MNSAIFNFLTALCVSQVASQQSTIDNGTECQWIHNRTCPDPEIRFYLYTRMSSITGQLIHVDDTWETSNLSSSYFNSQHSTKIIIHGFRSDFFLTPLFEMKAEYLETANMNVFYVDWFNLSSSICYPAVVHNIKHVGECCGQLVKRIRDTGNNDIHIIGFSLGAQVANYISESLKPDYILQRISGLDPAMPGFITVHAKDKLDASDAKFVDVYHCNSLIQSKFETCGHVDFYFNNAIIQPGCSSNGNSIIACSHQRCADYFMESIRSTVGFYGRQCKSYLHYIFGLCGNEASTIAGENCLKNTRGIYFVGTNSNFPFAKGREARMWSEREIQMKVGNDLRDVCDVVMDENFRKFLTCERFEPKVILIVAS